MKAAELEGRFRREVGDAVRPYELSSEDFLALLNEAQREAAERGDLIRLADDAGLCEIAVNAAASSITLTPLLTRLTDAWWLPAASEDCPEPQRLALELVNDRQVLDRRSATWRYASCPPRALLLEGRRARFDCLPDTAGTLIVEGFRLPKADIADKASGSDAADVPEIEAVHHGELVNWVKARYYAMPDPEKADPRAGEACEDAFTRYFGPKRDRLKGSDFEVPTFNRVDV